MDTALSPDLIHRFAAKYIWWKSPEAAAEYPDRIAAQVMNLGTWEDGRELAALLGEEGLRGVINRSEAGWFTLRSWNYWHYRLGLADIDHPPPPPPARRFG